ncbi:hypothetical protein MRX96_045379 [Rhipicephalus microplus]
MPVNRFEEIQKFLHFKDNSDTLSFQSDHVARMRPVIDALNEALGSAVDPEEYQSVEEMVIPIKGRSSIKQYLPIVNAWIVWRWDQGVEHPKGQLEFRSRVAKALIFRDEAAQSSKRRGRPSNDSPTAAIKKKVFSHAPLEKRLDGRRHFPKKSERKWTNNVIESLTAAEEGNSASKDMRILGDAMIMLQYCLEGACDAEMSKRNARDLHAFLEQRKLALPGDFQRLNLHPLDVLLDLAINWHMPLWFSVERSRPHWKRRMLHAFVFVAILSPLCLAPGADAFFLKKKIKLLKASKGKFGLRPQPQPHHHAVGPAYLPPPQWVPPPHVVPHSVPPPVAHWGFPGDYSGWVPPPPQPAPAAHGWVAGPPALHAAPSPPQAPHTTYVVEAQVPTGTAFASTAGKGAHRLKGPHEYQYTLHCPYELYVQVEPNSNNKDRW